MMENNILKIDLGFKKICRKKQKAWQILGENEKNSFKKTKLWDDSFSHIKIYSYIMHILSTPVIIIFKSKLGYLQ